MQVLRKLVDACEIIARKDEEILFNEGEVAGKSR